MWQIAVAVVLLGFGFAAGWALGRSASRSEPEPLPDAAPTPAGELLDAKRFAELVERSLRLDERTHAVLLIEVDGFGDGTPPLQSGAVEGLAIAAGRRLESALRPEDLAARAGLVRFAVLLHGVRDQTEATYAAMRLREILHRPYSVDLHDLRITTSVGIALQEPGIASAERLLAHATSALRDAQRSGHSASAVYEHREA